MRAALGRASTSALLGLKKTIVNLKKTPVNLNTPLRIVSKKKRNNLMHKFTAVVEGIGFV